MDNCMYANKITVTTNGEEAFLKFDFLAPKYGEDNETIGQEVRQSQEIMVKGSMLPMIRDLLTKVIEDKREN